MITKRIALVLEDPAIHFCLKGWIREALTKDPVDAWKNAELLATLLREQLEVI